MELHELRKLVKVTETLPDDTAVFVDYCGYTADNEWLEDITIRTDGQTDVVTIKVTGRAYPR